VTQYADDEPGAWGEPLGAFIIRAWVHDRSLVARVVCTPDVAAVAPISVVVVTPNQLRSELDRWLEGFGLSKDI
jgi:hypothetical protein